MLASKCRLHNRRVLPSMVKTLIGWRGALEAASPSAAALMSMQGVQIERESCWQRSCFRGDFGESAGCDGEPTRQTRSMFSATSPMIFSQARKQQIERARIGMVGWWVWFFSVSMVCVLPVRRGQAAGRQRLKSRDPAPPLPIGRVHVQPAFHHEPSVHIHRQTK